MESQTPEQIEIEKLRLLLKETQTKTIMKEAVNEWLEDKFATVGKWTLSGIVALALALLVYALIDYAHWRPL